MNRLGLAGTLIGISFLFLNSARAEDLYSNDKIHLWGGIGSMGGDVTYQIGGHVVGDFTEIFFSGDPKNLIDVNNPLLYYGVRVHVNEDDPWPISELKWPTNVRTVTLGGDIALNDNWQIRGQFSSPLESSAGKMEDSDWDWTNLPPWARNPSEISRVKDIYSTSDATVKLFTGDVGVRYWFKKHQWYDESDLSYKRGFDPFYGVGAGLIYEDYSWEASNLDQYYPWDPSYPHAIVRGLVGTYKSSLRIPYVEVVAQQEKENYGLTISLGYSPFVQATDADEHLLRLMRSKANMQGHAIKGSLSGHYDVLKNVFLMLQFDFLTITTEGTSSVSVYGDSYPDYPFINPTGDNWVQDHIITQIEYNFIVSAGIRF